MRQSSHELSVWGWASGHDGRAMCQHKGAGQLGRPCGLPFVGSSCISFGFCLRHFAIAGPILQICAWRWVIWVCLAVICVSILVQFSAVVEGEGLLRQSLLGACRPSWSSSLCSGPWLDSWLQALTICRAGTVVLYAVVSFSEFKGREILGVLLCLHLGQRQTNSLLWVCSKALLLGQIAAE